MDLVGYNFSQIISFLTVIGIFIAIFAFIPALIADIVMKRFFWLKRVLILGVAILIVVFLIIPLIVFTIGR